ncbi:DUF3592 domain-containing protein [Streptomyces sp. Da 82-17]|uniref:DUF3592 domain-containing protein n=1 Tax=Streptomyces sp. Da 82-17 TaxID=3377116 RepID=UPI0038D3E66E
MTSPWLWLLAGVPATAVSLLWLLHAWRRARTWTRVEATVVSVKDGTAPDRTPRTVVKYRYVDASGKTHVGVDHPTFRKPRRGSTTPARYNPESPEISETVSGYLVLYLGVAAVGAFGIGAVAVGLTGLSG